MFGLFLAVQEQRIVVDFLAQKIWNLWLESRAARKVSSEVKGVKTGKKTNKRKLSAATPHCSPMQVIHRGEDRSKMMWLYNTMTTNAVSASPSLWASLWAESLLKIQWLLHCQKKHLPPLAHSGSAKQKNP